MKQIHFPKQNLSGASCAEGWVEVGIQLEKLLLQKQTAMTRGEVKPCFGEKVQQKNFVVEVLLKARHEMASNTTALYSI